MLISLKFSEIGFPLEIKTSIRSNVNEEKLQFLDFQYEFEFPRLYSNNIGDLPSFPVYVKHILYVQIHVFQTSPWISSISSGRSSISSGRIFHVHFSK